MMLLGESEVVEVFKYLGLCEVQKLGVIMVVLKNVLCECVFDVFDVFFVEVEDLLLDVDLNEYICIVFCKVLGDDCVVNIIDCILLGGDISGIEGLKWMDVLLVVELICNEYLQIIVMILVYLDCDQVLEILIYFIECLCNDIILCIVMFDGIQFSVLCELNDVLIKLL